MRDDEVFAGFAPVCWLMLLVAAGVAVFGPPSPMFGSWSGGSTIDAAVARENAVKLNPNVAFVRMYCFGRDVVAPVVVVMGVAGWSARPSWRGRLLIGAALAAAFYVGLWSGQKATAVNYLIALLLWTLHGFRSTLRRLVVWGPLVALTLVAVFVVTQPEIFRRGVGGLQTARIVWGSIHYRILEVPLLVASLYAHAKDHMGLVGPCDALPFYFFWHPAERPIESTIGRAFFHQGFDSSQSNTLAFAYAYVLAGSVGCLVGGAALSMLMSASARVVDLARSRFASTAFNAYLCYFLLDLLNANFLQYLINNLVLAAGVCALYHPWTRRALRRVMAWRSP
jgi:hypothetical protein